MSDRDDSQTAPQSGMGPRGGWIPFELFGRGKKYFLMRAGNQIRGCQLGAKTPLRGSANIAGQSLPECRQVDHLDSQVFREGAGTRGEGLEPGSY